MNGMEYSFYYQVRYLIVQNVRGEITSIYIGLSPRPVYISAGKRMRVNVGGCTKALRKQYLELAS
jgi:hypothetical protein